MRRDRTVLFMAFAVGLFLLQSLSIMNEAPPASPDAAVFADAALNLLSAGHLGTGLVVGMTDHVYWQPPGYCLALAAAFKVFGYGLWQLRLLSLLFGALCLWMVYEVSLKVHTDQVAAMIAVLLLSFDPLFAKWARWDRMDPMCMFFVLLSLSLYLTAAERPHLRFFVAAGTSASAALLVHPFGVISFAAIALHAIFVRRPSGKETVSFLSPLMLGGWAMYIAQDPEEFLVQIQYQVNRKLHHDSASLLGVFSQYRFYPSYIMVVMGALASAFGYKRKPSGSGNALIVIAVLIVVCSYVVIKGPYYHVYLAPILAIAGSMNLARWLRLEVQGMRRLVASFLALLALNGVAYTGSITWLYKWNLKQEANHEVLARRILQYLPGDARIGHFGYPTPYWALNALHESGRLREMYFLRRGNEEKVFEGLDYLVFTQSSNPVSDNKATRQDVDFSEAVLGREGRHLRLVASVGADVTNAYRALIYSIESGYDVVGRGDHPLPTQLRDADRESTEGTKTKSRS